MEGEKEGVVVEQPKRLKSFSSEHFGQTNILKLNLNSKNPTPYSFNREEEQSLEEVQSKEKVDKQEK